MPGFFGRLFGAKKSTERASERPAPAPVTPEDDTEVWYRSDSGASDLIFKAMEASGAGDHVRAEQLFQKGIERYRRREPDGVDYALGRYAAFLIEQGRAAEALRLLDDATKAGTDIPAIWSDYLQLLADSRDINAFSQGVNRMAASRVGVDAEFLLSYARRADREDASAFAEAVARLVVERCKAASDESGRWAAIGDLGRILENADRLEEAMPLWRATFDEGSTDPETTNRLSMHLERSKDYSGAIAVITEGLKRGLPANVEETLRKRLTRCETKAGGKKSPKSAAARPDVAAYSIREGAQFLQPLFQLRLKPAIKDLEIRNGNVRCLLATKESTEIVAVNIASGDEIRRAKAHHAMGNLWFAPPGHGLGVYRTAAIGKGPSLLRFLDRDCNVVAESSVPDATTEISWAGSSWYVGCRDGLLYAFDASGKHQWRWQTPGSERFSGLDTFRPCPYTLAASADIAVVASMDNIYCVSSFGQSLWHAVIPNASKSSSITHGGMTVTIEMQGMGPTASFVHIGATNILIGSSQGRLYELDFKGKIVRETGIGEGHTKLALTHSGSVAAVWAKPSLLFIDDGQIAVTQGMIDWPAGLLMFGAEVVLWRRNDLEVIDRVGKVLWRAEFSKAITHVATYGGTLVCAAGPLIAFRRME